MSEKYEFIDGEKYAYPIVAMCRWLAVSKSGYYEWSTRPASATVIRREEFKALITDSFDGSDGTYGYRRVHAELRRWGWACSPEFVRALMRELGLVACQPRPWRHCLTDAGDAAALPDLVDRDFTAAAPGHKLVGDITYVPTWEGWLYLATVIDCHTKEVIGWATDDHYKTPLITAAITMAATTRVFAADAVFHSDRGSNYTSHDYAQALKSLKLRQSVGRTGICYDNALAESFFAALKVERVHRTEYPTRAHAQTDIVGYIELRYNTKRLHSGLDYRTPREVHNEYLNQQQAA